MNHLSFKSLAFYGIAIGSVAVLFKAVTAWGETSLKAPPAIAGNYRFDPKSLPKCLKSNALVLTIEQSGVYLNGNLRSGNSKTNTKKMLENQPSLTGKWENQGLSLSGYVTNLAGCNGVKTTDGKSFVKLRGIIKGTTLNGKISLGNNATATDFTAKRDAAVKQDKKEH
ncbi:MAG: hypothetical protein ACRC62_12020 [Microcoleus sp.]